MRKINLVLPFFFLFLFLSTNALGYEIFTANPYFNDTNSVLPYGVVLYNALYNNTFYWNTTCNSTGSTGSNCLIIENNGTNQRNILFFQQEDWLYTGLNPQWSNLTALQLFDSGNSQNDIPYKQLLLPKNQEGIIVFNYRWNDTVTTPAPVFFIDFINPSGTTIEINLNTTPNVWYNVTYILNASTSDRYIQTGLDWYWDNLNTSLMMDKFKFYTYDLIETRTSFSSNFTYERNRYCGDASANITYSSSSSYLPSQYNNTNGYLLATGEDGYECNVFKIGNTFVARRLIYKDTDGTWGWVNSYRDPFYFIIGSQAGAGSIKNKFLVTKLSITSAEIVPMQNTSTTIYDGCSFWFNGIYTNVNISQPSNTGFFDNLANYSRQTINLIPWSNYTPPATQWEYYQGIFGGGATGKFTSLWYNFFSENLFVCDAQTKCDPANNSQYYQRSDCTFTNYQDCSYCGCNPDLTGCDYPSTLGTQCDLSDSSKRTFITNHSDCTVTSDQCPVGSTCEQLTPQYNASHSLVENMADCSHCYFLGQILFNGSYVVTKTNCQNTPECYDTCPFKFTPFGTVFLCWGSGVYYYNETIVGNLNATQYTIACIDSAGTAVQIIDQNGNNTTEEQIITNIVGTNVTGNESTPVTPTYATNAFGTASLYFGSLFGMGGVENIATDEAMLSLLISLSVGITILWYARNTEHASNGLALGFLGTLTIFTIGLGNVLLWAIYVVLIILSAGILTGYFSKILGGG